MCDYNNLQREVFAHEDARVMSGRTEPTKAHLAARARLHKHYDTCAECIALAEREAQQDRAAWSAQDA